MTAYQKGHTKQKTLNRRKKYGKTTIHNAEMIAGKTQLSSNSAFHIIH